MVSAFSVVIKATGCFNVVHSDNIAVKVSFIGRLTVTTS